MKKAIILMSLVVSMTAAAQTYTHYTTTEGREWQESKASLSGKAATEPVLTITGKEQGVVFRAWGTTFNELDWDAFNLLSRDEQDEVMRNLFSPTGDLRFTHGRVSMNANDYARSWYSCDDVVGDLGLHYFNIERDKRNIIPLARAAQKYCPQLQLFMSPWSPPTWMKINQDYCVLSSPYNSQPKEKDYLLYMEQDTHYDADEMKLLGDRNGVFPRRLAAQDYFIQEPRYLQSYANMFCRFIDLYAEQGLPITKVMYQNEAYSYTPYPGCAWTAEGTLRFNNEYLAPTLAKLHPEVELWIGTFNTNRLDYVEKIIDNPTLQANVKGIGTQWECRENLPQMRLRYPNLRFMVSESECGNGAMDWAAAEHTFFLLSDNLGNGCDEYYNWNFILADKGLSTWGWTQNALIQVDSQTRRMRYTPEYYAYKHFSHFIAPGSKMQGYVPREQTKGMPVIVFQRPDKRYVIIAGNQTDEQRTATICLDKKYLNMTLPAHSMHSYIAK
ncbi:MAG: glycoside hydrolase family 30 protein [Bacteroidaceae bacterium]|nr:glycoside hydrolase family 30 protein [Bacteroidaceae bacterium]